MSYSLPFCSIHPSYISLNREVVIKNSTSNYYSEKDDRLNQMLKSKRTAEGYLSLNAKRKLNKAIEYLLYLSAEKKVYNRLTRKTFNFKVAFITLTLSSEQMHSDNEIRKKLLNQMLVEFRKYYNVKNYVWRAEKQKNGNIHFHIIIDRFIPWWELRNRWNRIQNKLGYVDRFKERIRMQKRVTKEKYNNPNSVDIHSLYRVRNIKKYLSKYLSKNVKNANELTEEEKSKLLVKGRLWGANQELSNVKGARVLVDREIESELIKLIESDNSKVLNEDYYSIIFIDITKLSKKDYPNLISEFEKYVKNTFERTTYEESIELISTCGPA
jgi:hypothetical protein